MGSLEAAESRYKELQEQVASLDAQEELTADRLRQSEERIEGLQIQLEEEKLKHTNDLAVEKDKIKEMFENMTKDFENTKLELENKLTVKEEDITDKKTTLTKLQGDLDES